MNDGHSMTPAEARAASGEGVGVERYLQRCSAGEADGGVPVRRWSAKGKPKSFSPFTRTCHRCRACFLGLAAGRTGERGIWNNTGRWWCSIECYDLTYGAGSAHRLITGFESA